MRETHSSFLSSDTLFGFFSMPTSKRRIYRSTLRTFQCIPIYISSSRILFFPFVVIEEGHCQVGIFYAPALEIYEANPRLALLLLVQQILQVLLLLLDRNIIRSSLGQFKIYRGEREKEQSLKESKTIISGSCERQKLRSWMEWNAEDQLRSVIFLSGL